LNKKTILPVLALGLLATGAIIWQTGVASAYFGGGNGTPDKMAEELATKLNVSQDKVTTALEEIKTAHQAERQAEVTTNLDKAVTDGAITAEQKQKLLDKMAENQKERQEARAERKQNRDEMEQWLKDNGIDSEKLHSYIGFGQGQGGRHGNAE